MRNMLSVHWIARNAASAQRAVAGACALAVVLLLVLTPFPSAFRGVGVSGLSALARVNAALGVWLLVPLFSDKQRNQAWRLVAAGLGLWFAADCLHLAGWIAVPGGPPMPFPSEWLRIAGSAAYLSALFIYPVGGSGGFGRVRNVLEVSLITVAVLALIWLVIIRPVVQVGIPNTVAAIWAISVLTMDFAAIALSLRLATLARPRDERRLFLGLAAALLLIIAGNFLEMLQILNRGVRSAGLAEAGWTLGSGVAALVFVQVRDMMPLQEWSPDWKQGLDLVSRLARHLPLLLIYLVVGFIIVDWRMNGRFDTIGVLAAALLSMLLVARQGVLAGQSEMRQHAALVNAAADLAFICRLDGSLVLANPALRQAVGRPGTDEDELTIDELIAGEGPEGILEAGAEGGWSGEVTFVSGVREPFPVALSLRPFADERLEEPLLAATAHDLTELKAGERELRSALGEIAEARQELQELNATLESKVESRTEELAETVERLERLNEELKELDRLKSEFVTLVSHELRAPLTNIRSGVELALKRPAQIPGSVEETLQLVSAETERLADFVEIILDLSALEAGRFPLAEEGIPLREVAQAVVGRIPQTAGKGRIEIRISEDIPPARGDESAVASILFHLLDNALKYAPSGPVIVGAEDEESVVRVIVEDCGPGIPSEERETVFDRFHRLDPSDAREVYGHGLGLYLSRRLVEAMGGGVRAEESTDGGARLLFWLPAFQSG